MDYLYCSKSSLSIVTPTTTITTKNKVMSAIYKYSTKLYPYFSLVLKIFELHRKTG
jgi:hypothetical protein